MSPQRIGIVMCVLVLLTAVSSHLVAATLTGTVRYNGQPVMNYATSPVEFWVRNEDTNQAVACTWTFNTTTSTYSTELPPGNYGIQTHIWENTVGFFPGNYYGWASPINIPEGASTVNRDLAISKLIHLTSPIDNNLKALWPYGFCLPDNDIVFEWEPIAEAESYQYFIDEWQSSPYQLRRRVAIDTTVDRSVVIQLEPNQGSHYQFHLFAFNSDGVLVGQSATTRRAGGLMKGPPRGPSGHERG